MKTLALLPLLFLCIWSSGCKKDEIIVPNNPNQTILQNIQPGAWVLNSDNSAYMVDISMPEIDADANELDAIVVSVSAGATGAYEAIPNVYSGVSFSYTHQVGRVTLEVQSADGTAPVRPTSLIRAKIVIIRSN
jgi:hypothetical protein